MNFVLWLLVLTSTATAAPGCPFSSIKKRQVDHIINNNPRSIEQTEDNCGPLPCLSFNAAEQLIDVRAPHDFRPPGPNDRRGPCPGLNAAANHGFLNRNGITTITQAMNGLYEAYGMGKELGAALAAVAVGLSGDFLALPEPTWSIGGSYSASLLGGLAGLRPSGISFTHNSYEGDGSPTRFDAYMNNGNPNSLNMTRFRSLYAKANANGEFTPTILRDHNKECYDECVLNNPRCFRGPFAGLVPAVAHQFIPNYMSNHSESRPNGFLNKDVLKSFFAITGPEDALTWTDGHERIPDNWYKRSLDNPYDTVDVAVDALILASKYPEIITSIGGNTGSPNTFTGVDFLDLTGGVYNAQNLAQGNNAACFAYQVSQTSVLSRVRLPSLPLLGDAMRVLEGFITSFRQKMAAVMLPLTCPELTRYEQSQFEQFPGWIFG